MKIILFFSLVLLTTGCEALQDQPIQVEDGPVPYQAQDVQVSLRAVAQDLELPWDMAFINDKEFLVTEKPGRLSRINLASGESTLIQGLPEVAFKGQGGLLGVALHPLFAENAIVYLSYSIALDEGTYTTRLLRARLSNQQLVEQQVLFTAEPALKTSKHFGGALVFDVADLIKDTLILPWAFICAKEGATEQEFRQQCLQNFTKHKALDFMFDSIKQICAEANQL